MGKTRAITTIKSLIPLLGEMPHANPARNKISKGAIN
jgi:hypothetical protein